jgi:hypothetical protein
MSGFLRLLVSDSGAQPLCLDVLGSHPAAIIEDSDHCSVGVKQILKANGRL